MKVVTLLVPKKIKNQKLEERKRHLKEKVRDVKEVK